MTKALVRQSLPLGESRTHHPGLLDLTHVHNTGAAFGLLNAADFPYKPVVMIAIAAIAWWRSPRTRRSSAFTSGWRGSGSR